MTILFIFMKPYLHKVNNDERMMQIYVCSCIFQIRPQIWKFVQINTTRANPIYFLVALFKFKDKLWAAFLLPVHCVCMFLIVFDRWPVDHMITILQTFLLSYALVTFVVINVLLITRSLHENFELPWIFSSSFRFLFLLYDIDVFSYTYIDTDMTNMKIIYIAVEYQL